MSIVFNADEVVGMAVQIERNGQKFYARGVGNIANDAQKLISPMTEYSLENYFEIVPGPGLINPDQLAPWPSLLNTAIVGESRPTGHRLR